MLQAYGHRTSAFPRARPLFGPGPGGFSKNWAHVLVLYIGTRKSQHVDEV